VDEVDWTMSPVSTKRVVLGVVVTPALEVTVYE
jgi:hypothetical protein